MMMMMRARDPWGDLVWVFGEECTKVGFGE